MKIFIVATLFLTITASYHILWVFLPACLKNSYIYIAHVFLGLYVSSWLTELTIHLFLISEIKPKKKAILITGCDTGFGHALAKKLEKKGFKVFACCLDPNSAGSTNLKETSTGQLKVIGLDVTSDQSVEDAVHSVKEYLGDSVLWAIVNNAGVLKGFHIELSRMKDFEDCIQVNALGTVRVTKAFLPLLRKSKGRIVNICSMAGRFPCQYLSAYNMSKFAQWAFTQVLRREMEEFGIRVISVEPEFFKTPITSTELLKKQLENILEDVDKSVKAAYGDKYISKAMQAYLALFRVSSSNAELVINAVVKTVSLRNPEDTFKPCRNTSVRLLFFALERIPQILVDIGSMLLLSIVGVPKPKSQINGHESL